MFYYSPDLDDAVSRVRARVGDTTAPGFLQDETYEALLSVFAQDEIKTRREIAAMLAAKYASQPDSISDDGSTIRWSERVKQWNLIALGKDGGAAEAEATTAKPVLDFGTLSWGFQEDLC